MNEQSVAYGNERIRFTLNRRTAGHATRIAIHVDPDGSVTVDAPPDAAPDAIRNAVARRARWISTHRSAALERNARLMPREYVSGEAVYYLGRRYRLKVRVDAQASASTAMRGGFIEVVVRARGRERVRVVLDAWYRDRAREVFVQRMAAFSRTLGWLDEMPPTRLRAMSRQWGSCSPAGLITLNPALVKAPRECIDYVVLHELCHLQHHNHSAKFYRCLDRHMPGWREVKQRLDGMAGLLLDG